jgi:hypothetical protein
MSAAKHLPFVTCSGVYRAPDLRPGDASVTQSENSNRANASPNMTGEREAESILVATK